MSIMSASRRLNVPLFLTCSTSENPQVGSVSGSQARLKTTRVLLFALVVMYYSPAFLLLLEQTGRVCGHLGLGGRDKTCCCGPLLPTEAAGKL